MAASSPLVIRELSGPQRTVRLVGRALPFRGLQLSGEQTIELTQLPGAPERTLTVLGPVEQPTTIHGKWSTMFLGAGEFTLDNRPLTTAREVVKAVDSMRLLGQLVEFTWLDSLRRGIIKRFDQTWLTSEDVEWSLTLEWVSRGEQTAPVVFVTDASMGDAFANTQSLFGFLDSIAVPDVPLLDDVLNSLQAFTNGIGNLVLDLEDAVINFTDKITSPVRAIRGLVATLQSLENETELMTAFLLSRPASALGSKPADEQSYSEKQSLELYREELRAWASALRRSSIESRTNLMGQIQTTLLATYVARAGQDLRDVSKQFYGTPFEWRRLMIFNDLNEVALEAGQLVLVPPLSVEQAAPEAPGN